MFVRQDGDMGNNCYVSYLVFFHDGFLLQWIIREYKKRNSLVIELYFINLRSEIIIFFHGSMNNDSIMI